MAEVKRAPLKAVIDVPIGIVILQTLHAAYARNFELSGVKPVTRQRSDSMRAISVHPLSNVNVRV